MEVELERELAAEQEELLEEEEDELGLQHALEMAHDLEKQPKVQKPLSKVLSLPANFTFSSPRGSLDMQEGSWNPEGFCPVGKQLMGKHGQWLTEERSMRSVVG